MRVVFLEEVEGTARTGDVKNVAAGFARNYLLPRNLAAPANDHYIAIAQAKAGKEAKRQERLDDEARAHLLPKVDGLSFSIEVRVGEQGKLFGSVTNRDIAELVQEGTKIELEHKQVDLREPIRDLGAHPVRIKLTRNVIATVTVNVEPLGGAVVAEAAPAAEIEAVEDASAPDETPEAEAEETTEPEAADESEPAVEEPADEPAVDEPEEESEQSEDN